MSDARNHSRIRGGKGPMMNRSTTKKLRASGRRATTGKNSWRMTTVPVPKDTPTSYGPDAPTLAAVWPDA